MAALPAAFMSGVTGTYILMADEGLRLSPNIAYPLGLAFALICAGIYIKRVFCKAADARENS